MNLKVHQYDTFRRHARNLVEPAIYHKWKTDQSKLLEEMKRKGKLAVSGDMRADSPGNCDKPLDCENKQWYFEKTCMTNTIIIL